jgi:hypothetical protein
MMLTARVAGVNEDPPPDPGLGTRGMPPHTDLLRRPRGSHKSNSPKTFVRMSCSSAMT